MKKDDIIQKRLINNFYRNDYNDKVFGIQAQNIDAAGLTLFLRDNKINNIIFQKKLESYEYIRTWGQRNTLHVYNHKYYHLMRIFNESYGNWFEKKWKVTDKHSYLKSINIAIEVCKKNEIITKDLLIENGVEKRFIDNWGGIFIDLCQRGYLYPDIINRKTEFRNHEKTLGMDMAYKKCSDSYADVMNKICILYFDFYGPAQIKDFSHWSGLDKNKARIIVDRNRSKLVKTDEDYFDLKKRKTLDFDVYNEIIITSKFDNIFLAYAEKQWIANKDIQNKIWIKSGLIEASIIYHNTVVGVWRYKKGSAMKVYVKLFYSLKKDVVDRVLSILKKTNEDYWLCNCDIEIVEKFN